MGSSLRILILAHYYPPEMGGATARLHGLARWLKAFGHEVTVVTGMPNYPSGIVAPPYRGKLTFHEVLGDVRIVRTWVFASSHRHSVLRLANYLSFVLSAVVSSVALWQRFDVVLASSPPLFIGLAGWFLARLWGIRWVFDLRDLWPDVAVEAGEFAPHSLLARGGYGLAHFLSARADHLTPATQKKRQRLIEAGVPDSTITVVSNGIDLEDLLADKPKGEGRRADQFTVIYAGLIGIAQGVELVVEAADKLREQPHIQFLIAGDGVRRADLVEAIAQRQLHTVTFMGYLARDVIPQLLRSADVAWVPLVSDQLVDAVPSKLLEAWGCGLPVILSAGGEAARLVEESGGGMAIPAGHADRLAEAIQLLEGNRALLQSYATRGHEYAVTHFERSMLARRMEQALFHVAHAA
jgi:putative colanic acid biosynthesis glycosyltransferase WcaI